MTAKEHRGAARTATTQLAVIQAANKSQIDCTVVNLSATGAQVRIPPNNLSRGERVTLLLISDHTEVDAEVVWTKAPHVGLRLTTPFRRVPRKYDYVASQWTGKAKSSGKR